MPVSIGKPAPYLLEAAAHAVGREPAEAIMIGDGIATDLAAARAVGARCVFMLTGVTTRAEVEALPADEQPTAIAADAGGARGRRSTAWADDARPAGARRRPRARLGPAETASDVRRHALGHGAESPSRSARVGHQPTSPIAATGVDGSTR